MGKRRLTHVSQRQGGHRDSQSAGGQRMVEAIHEPFGRICKWQPILNHLVDLAGPNFDQSKFGGDKKSIQDHQEDRQQDHS